MKEEKNILIFTNETEADEAESNYMDNYINNLVGKYTVVMTENNQGILESEEGDAFITMEYK
jgi:hypothetical protein